MPKLAHQKSRRGCLRCKKRKVKCDESRPSCGACTRHQIHCEYDDSFRFSVQSSTIAPRLAVPAAVPAASASPTITETATSHGHARTLTPGSEADSRPSTSTSRDSSRMLELRLLHQWITKTMASTTSNNLLIWTNDVAELAFDHDFLIDAMLALAALHLSRLDRGSTRMVHISQTYFDRAVTGQAGRLTSIDSLRDAEACFCAGAIISVYSFALHASTPNPNVRSHEIGGLFQWLRIARGLLAVHVASEPFDPSVGVLARIITAIPDLSEDKVIFNPANIHGHEHLLSHRAEVEPISDEDRLAYEQAVAFTGFVWGVVDEYKESLPVAIGRCVIAVPARMPQRFMEMVEERRPRALVILAYILASLNHIRQDIWWLTSIGPRAVTLLDVMLPPGWEPLMQYPLQTCEMAEARKATESA